MKKIILIDGNSILNRAYYGISGTRVLTTSDGTYTNAIVGFLNIFYKYVEEEKPGYICVAFDLKAPTFRHKEYDAYKAGRKKMPDELAMQVPIIKEVLDAMNIMRVEIEGYEADDIIGTMSKLANNVSIEAVIVTGDKDSFQLISENVRVKLPRTKAGKTETEEYNLGRIKEEYGILPKQFIELKGLMGDSSDNIPGVKGVGEKTALKLIQEFDSLENLYQNIESTKESLKNKLENDKEMAFLSRKLGMIDQNVPLNIDLEQCVVKDYDKEKLFSIFKKLEFKSFIEKLGLKNNQNVSNEQISKYQMVALKNKEDIDNNLKILDLKDIISISYFMDNPEIGPTAIAIYSGEKVAIVKDSELINHSINKLREYSNRGAKICGCDIKDFYIWQRHVGNEEKLFWADIMIGAYVLDPSENSYSIDRLADKFLGIQIESILVTGKKGKAIDIEEEELLKRLSDQAVASHEIYKIMNGQINDNQQEYLFYEIEMPLVETLADMEFYGFRVDSREIDRISEKLEEKINVLTREIYSLSGEEFNINSPKQLGVILFEKLGLKTIKKTKTGYSTNAEVLEQLLGSHDIIEKLIEYRQYVKLKSTYTDGLKALINPKTGRIHSKFNQTVTTTGRISSTEPNLQNIPIKLEAGREIRKSFIAENEEYVLLDADYSQIELRVLAHISDDENMKMAFTNNVDIHTLTAMKVFGVSEEEITPVLRSRAKAVNFGIVYGIGDFSLSKDIGTSRKEARLYIDGYLGQYPKVKEYMSDIVSKGKENGYVSTIFNRRRYLPELSASNFVVRSFGERIAMNTPIQGSAADIIKIAMVKVRESLKSGRFKSRLILQVHDELIIETHVSEVLEVKKILSDCMQNAVKLSVPLTVEVKTGKSWYETK